MKKAIIFFTIILSINILKANNRNIVSDQIPEKIPLWTLYVPGACYYYQNKPIQGTIFSTLEIGGIYLGFKYDKNLKNNSSTPYYNYPLFIGLKAFDVEKLSYFRNRLERMSYYRPDFRYDKLSEKELYLAPFKKENIFTPITGGMILLAGVFLGFEKLNEKNTLSDVDQMYMLDRYVDRNPAMAFYGTNSMALSWGAGVSEEYIFRNFVMPLYDYRFGQRKGLIYSSLIFGGIHFQNVFFADKPDYSEALLQVIEATILGYFLGNDVQKRQYNIGPAVAAHVWYDAVLMLGSFLLNPENNVFGVNIQFKIE